MMENPFIYYEEKIEALQEKLDIAVKALKKIEVIKDLNLSDKVKVSLSFKLSNEALAKIKDIK